MPKLAKSAAKAVAKAEVRGDFEVLAPGKYIARLRTVTAKEGPSGPMWTWEFEIPPGLENAGRRFWHHTSLSDQAHWKLAETFAAFGVKPDTDTDELCGQTVELRISQRTIQKGERTGELTNSVDKVLPHDDDEAAESDDDEDDEDDDDEDDDDDGI